METVSDIYGDFEFEGLANNAAYKITIVEKGYAAKTIEVKTHTDVNLGEIVLELVVSLQKRLQPIIPSALCF